MSCDNIVMGSIIEIWISIFEVFVENHIHQLESLLHLTQSMGYKVAECIYMGREW